PSYSCTPHSSLHDALPISARAKGLNRGQVLYRHALRNALLPVIRQIGLQFSTLITLAMITEVIFSWPGIGRWLIDSIYQRNYPRSEEHTSELQSRENLVCR